MDLLDIDWFPLIEEGYKLRIEQYRKIGIPAPRQKSFKPEAPAGPHQLDCDVLNHMVGVLGEKNIVIRSIRAVFLEGIAVRDHAVIKELTLLPTPR